MKKYPKRGPYKVPRHEVVQPLDESIKLIPLTQGQNAIVDAADFEWLSQWNWSAHWCPDTKSFYALRETCGKTVSMHATILSRRSGELVDHRNRNPLDNRRENLRKCNHAQNARNSGKPITNKSGFKGVCWHTAAKKWSAKILDNGQRRHLGYFLLPEEAARAYDEAAKIYHGEFAHLNFP